MFDITLETARFLVMLVIFGLLLVKGRLPNIGERRGWKFIVAGFGFLLFGSAIDITDNFDSLNHFVVIGDTATQAFLEKVVGYLLGFMLLFVGFWYWLPIVQEIAIAEQRLKTANEGLEAKVADRTADLEKANTQLLSEITERKQAQEKLIQASRMAILGEMATGAAHELNQPLNIIRMAADSTLERVEEGDFDAGYLRGKLERISAQTERAAAIIDHMRIFGRKADEDSRPIDLRNVTQDALGLIGEQIRLRGIEVETEIPEVCRPVSGHAVQLEQVLLNLLGNARDAVEANRRGPGEPRKITVKVEDTGPEDKMVRLIVEDTGGGIPENIISRIFEPFFTTKEPGQGTGLGLSISYGIVSDMGGTIEAANTGDGARITITLPVAGERTSASRKGEAQ